MAYPHAMDRMTVATYNEGDGGMGYDTSAHLLRFRRSDLYRLNSSTTNRESSHMKGESTMTTVYDFSAERIDGQVQPLSAYKGKVLLIVNTASRCGLTPQYEGLQALYEKYHDDGLEILGFPCNQFAGQEPGSNEEIREFCQTRYNVQFPMFAKIDVNGDKAHPLYQFLKQEAPGDGESPDIEWNFAKFLIDRQGRVVKRFRPQTLPEELEEDIRRELGR
jgi:glutathione peroxidase